jgi:diacylglycerol kinase family enzyme
MGEGFNILINRKSGTVLNMGEPAVEAAIAASEITVTELCLCEPDDMQANLERLSQKPEYLLIGGGDGAIRETAKYLSAHRKAFGVLPFGTMNLLAADLGLTSQQQALNTYAGGAREERMDAGFVNDEIFLCCASIGTMPQASVYREARRMTNRFLLLPQMFLFVAGNMDKHRRRRWQSSRRPQGMDVERLRL